MAPPEQDETTDAPAEVSAPFSDAGGSSPEAAPQTISPLDDPEGFQQALGEAADAILEERLAPLFEAEYEADWGDDDWGAALAEIEAEEADWQAADEIHQEATEIFADGLAVLEHYFEGDPAKFDHIAAWDIAEGLAADPEFQREHPHDLADAALREAARAVGPNKDELDWAEKYAVRAGAAEALAEQQPTESFDPFETQLMRVTGMDADELTELRSGELSEADRKAAAHVIAHSLMKDAEWLDDVNSIGGLSQKELQKRALADARLATGSRGGDEGQGMRRAYVKRAVLRRIEAGD